MLNTWKPLLITSAQVISYQALLDGFSETSHQHFYSRVPKDGWDNPVVKAAGAYLIDGVVDANMIAQGSGLEHLLARAGLDWITKGTCNAGDIRVSFETRSLPEQLSVLGKQQYPNLVVPHTFSNTKRYI